MSRKVKNGVAKEGTVAKAMCGSAAVSSSSEGSSANRGRSRESPSKNGSCISEEEEREQSPDIDAKGKKAKQRLTMDQINYLEMSFQADHTKAALEPCRKMAIAKHLELHPRQVAIWFQNRRARWKNKQLETDYDALKAKYDASLHHNRKLQAEVARLSALLKSSDAGDVVEDERKCKRVKVEADSNFVSPFPLNPSSPSLYEEVPKGTSDNEGEGSVISFALVPATTTTTTTSTTITGPLCNDFSSKIEDCLQGELVGDLLTTSSAPTSTISAPTSTIVPIGTGSVPIGTTTTMTSCMHFVPYYPDEEHHCNFILGWEDQEVSLSHPTIWEEWQGFYPWLD